MAASITGFTGTIPVMYDRYLGPLLFDPFAEDIAARMGPGAPYHVAAGRVLEVACGTGRLTRRLRQVLPAGVVLEATDLNPDMIGAARSLVPDKDIRWQPADARSLPFPDEDFDLVVCQFGIMFMPDKPAVMREFKRVLRPGGALLFNTWNSIGTSEVVHAASEIINGFFPGDPPAFYRSPFSFHEEDAIRGLVADAGFRDTRVELVRKTGLSPSAGDAAIGLVEGNPVIGFIRERDPGLLPLIRAAVEKEIGGRFGRQPLQSPLEAWVAGARKPGGGNA